MEAEPEKRRDAIEAWIQSAVPILSSAIEPALRSYIDSILETRWSVEGWESGAKKWLGLMDRYRLTMDIKLRSRERADKVQVVGPVSAEAHDEALRIANEVVRQIEEAAAEKLAAEREEAARAAQVVSSCTEAGDNEGNSEGGRGAGPSSNDQRSNVMNPNNPASSAAADNRSNQMNPNNPAYQASSRLLKKEV